MNPLNLFNKKNNNKIEEPCEISYRNHRSRTTEKRNGDVITETFSEEITIKGSSEKCKDIAANIALTNRQAEQQFLSEQAERPVKYLRPM